MRCGWCPAAEMRALGPCVLCAYAARETRRRALRGRILAALAGAAWLALWAWALAGTLAA